MNLIVEKLCLADFDFICFVFVLDYYLLLYGIKFYYYYYFIIIRPGKVGGRCKSWLRCVEEDLRMRGYALFSASRLALKRQVYRRKVVLG